MSPTETVMLVAIAALCAALFASIVRERKAVSDAEVAHATAVRNGQEYGDATQLLKWAVSERNEARHAATQLLDTHPFRLVRSMCGAYGQPVEDELQLDIPDDLRALRLLLLSEEFGEYVRAEQSRDIVEIADALGDMIVVIAGTAAAYGIPLQAVVEEIHRSNMTKVDPVTGQVEKRPDGKVVKPDSYDPPHLAALLGVTDDVDADSDVDAADVAATDAAAHTGNDDTEVAA